MTVALGIDALVAALLLVTIYFAVSLNRKLNQLRTSRAEFEKLVGEFGAAAVVTEGSIAALKDSTVEKQAALQENINRAEALRDELTFMLDRGDGLAEQLHGLIRAGRPVRPAGPVPDGLSSAPARGLRGFNSG